MSYLLCKKNGKYTGRHVPSHLCKMHVQHRKRIPETSKTGRVEWVGENGVSRMEGVGRAGRNSRGEGPSMTISLCIVSAFESCSCLTYSLK